jgi:hypothetical protein
MEAVLIPYYFENLNKTALKSLLETELYSKTYNSWGNLNKRNVIFSNLYEHALSKDFVTVFKLSLKDGLEEIKLIKERFFCLYDFYFKLDIRTPMNLNNKKDIGFKFVDDYFDFKSEDINKTDQDCVFFEIAIHKQYEKKVYNYQIMNDDKIEVRYF